MDTKEFFCNSVYADEVRKAERELFAFINAIEELFGPEQAKLSEEDWLDESAIMDSPPRSETRNWRAVTVAASARLANRLSVTYPQKPLVAKAPVKILTITSPTCFAPVVLV
jgi:hypothetical protein